MIRKIILLAFLIASLSSCTTTSDGGQGKILAGSMYQFNIEQDFSAEITHVGEQQAYVSYPSIPCKGVLDLLEKDEVMALYKETITEGVNVCTQGGYMKLEQIEGNYYVYYFWPTKDDFYAQGALFAK